MLAQRGKNGALTVSAANTVVNAYTSLSADAAAGTTSITVTSNSLNTHFSSNLAAGDLIMIIQMQGATIKGTNAGGIDNTTDSTWGTVTNYNNCGNWEFAEVESVSGTTIIFFDCPLSHSYTAAGKTQIVRAPRYSSLTINSPGSITCDAWNGSIGGACAIEVDNNTNINAGGSIDVSGKGFRGGQLDNTSHSPSMNLVFQASTKPEDGAEKGEGIAGYKTMYDPYGGSYMRGAPANGGGGGNIHNGGGAGGANGGSPALWNGHGMPDTSVAGYVTAWNLQYANFARQISSGGGQGGYAWSAANLDPTVVGPCNSSWGGLNRCAIGGYGGHPLDYSTGKLFLGGGGGAGDQDNNEAGAGANGGGLIYLMNYGTISGTGQIISNGSNGFNTTGATFASNHRDAAGGGGGGGTIVINSVGAISGISITANGGKGGDQLITAVQAEGPGGGGGGGYIAISNGAPTRTTNGGTNGITNSSGVNPEFPLNGATKGGIGTNTATVTNFIITATSTTICAGQSATLSANTSGTVPNGTTITWYDAITGGNIIGTGGVYVTPVLAAGTYTYYVGTCPGTYRLPVTVTVSNTPIVSVSPNTTICTGANVTLTATGGGSYSWSTTETTASINVTPTTTTMYVVSVGTSCGLATASVVVTVNSSITPGILGNTTICAGGTTTLTASGGGNYSWSTNETTAAIVVSPTTTTTYSVNVISGSCSGTASITVNVVSSINASISSGNTTICPGSVTTLTASGGSNYSWSTTETTASIVVSPTITTTYSVLVSAGSCSDVASVTLTVSNNGITPNINGPNNICNGGNAILTASGGGNYIWSTGQSTASITVSPTASTTYSVLVSAGTCTATASITVNVGSNITASITGNTTICGGVTSTLTASGGSSYIWNTGESTGIISITPTPSSTTTYTVIASSGSCKDTATITVNTLPTLFTYISGNTIICLGDVSTLTASVNNANNNTYLWSTGETTTTIMVAPTVTTTYSVTGYSGICSNTAPVTVTVIPQASAVVSPNTTICAGQSTILTVTGGTAYAWSNGAITSAITVSPLVNSTYVVIAGIGACTDTDSVSVAVMPSPTVTVSNNATICGGDLITLTASGGTTYTWSNGATSSATIVSPATTTSYSVIAKSGMCADTGKITIAVLPPPIATINGNNICQGYTGTLTASGGGTYLWNTGETTATIHPTAGGTYSVIVSVGSCTDTDVKNIIVAANPIATAFSDVTIIQGQSANLSATGGNTYAWNNNMNGANITVSPLSTTIYCVTVYDANSCYDTSCVTVTVELCSNAGTLYLPNAFSPNGDGENDELQIYYGATQCIKNFHLALYNRWGEKIYETSDPAFKWNGVYNTSLLKNTQQGGTSIYTYYMDAEIVDGTKISKKGNISLVR